MIQFVETETGGWINLATVSRIYHVKSRPGRLEHHLAHFLDGSEPVRLHFSFEPELHLARIVPAGYQVHVARVGCYFDPGVEPKIEDVFVELQPVVAWRLEYGCATPIITAMDASAETIAIPLGEGKWQANGEDLYNDLDALKRHIHQTAHDKWLKSQPVIDLAVQSDPAPTDSE